MLVEKGRPGEAAQFARPSGDKNSGGRRLQEVSFPMSSNNSASNFFNRVISNDAARRGLAGAVAGLLVAIVSEAVWGS